MQSKYKEYSNHTHQLLITPSKHFSADMDGKFLYQRHLLKLSLGRLTIPHRSAVVHYILRDKFSGAFYAEIYLADEIPPVFYFLRRAWSLNKAYCFGGLPEKLVVPSYAGSSEIDNLCDRLNIEQIRPMFSTEGGVRAIRTLETELVKYTGLDFDSGLRRRYPEILVELNKTRHPNRYLKTQRYDEKWVCNIKALRRAPTSLERHPLDFVK